MSKEVDHPSYYNRGNVEVIDFIEDWRLDFSMGSFVKYICRAGAKDDYRQDLEKAKWYIKRYADHPAEPIPEEWGTYGWREFAEQQGLEHELCIAMGIAYGLYMGAEIYLRLRDIIALIDVCIARYEHNKINESLNNTEHGVLEIGSEQ